MSYKDITRDQFNPRADVVNFVQNVVDFSATSSSAGRDTTINITTYTDGGKIALPIGKFKLSAFATDVRTAVGSAATANIGITGSLTLWHSALDINATGITASSGAETLVDNSAGDVFITIKPSVSVSTGKIHISFSCKVMDK